MKITSEQMDAMQSDVITVNELEPVLFENVHQLIKSDLDTREKLTYMNRLISFKDLNDNVLSEVYGFFKEIDGDAYMVKDPESGEVVFNVQDISGSVIKDKGIVLA